MTFNTHMQNEMDTIIYIIVLQEKPRSRFHTSNEESIIFCLQELSGAEFGRNTEEWTSALDQGHL